MKISVVGCGWYGYSLAKSLTANHDIYGTTRDGEKILYLKNDRIHATILDAPHLPQNPILDTDCMILNIPPSENQLAWFQSWAWKKEMHLVFVSSTSVYGKNQGTVSEELTPVPDTKEGQLLLKQEEWLTYTFPNLTILRFGGLVGYDRHPGKQLSGRQNLTFGKSPVNLLHRDDAVGFSKLVIEQKLMGVFNLVSDEHSSRGEFYTEYCKRNNLPLPSFDPDQSSGKLVTNQKVRMVYEFMYPTMIGINL